MVPSKMAFIACPFHQGDIKQNIKNAQQYSRFVYELGYIPIAPQLLAAQYMDDTDAMERALAIEMNLHIMDKCDILFLFGEVSPSMHKEIRHAQQLNLPIRAFSSDLVEHVF